MNRRWLAGAAVLMLVIAAGAELSTPAQRAGAVAVPPRNDDGEWDGSWMYVSLYHRVGLFFRTEEGRPRVKLMYQAISTPEQFETDWDGNAAYFFQGRPCSFALNLTERDANTIRGRWEWKTWRAGQPFQEFADFTMYRSGDGRKLVIDFGELEQRRTFKRAEQNRGFRQVWSFMKASRRVVHWDEMPW